MLVLDADAVVEHDSPLLLGKFSDQHAGLVHRMRARRFEIRQVVPLVVWHIDVVVQDGIRMRRRVLGSAELQFQAFFSAGARAALGAVVGFRSSSSFLPFRSPCDMAAHHR